MKHLRKILVLTAAAVLWAFLRAAWAADIAPTPFQKGDTVCVIGDSITHGGRYHSFVYLFYATRFPDRPFKMYNCGISGDTASGGCRRLDWDILAHKPTAATILLGMNDVGRNLYGKDKTDDKSKKAQQGAIARYASNMNTLAEGLKKAKCKVTFLTPTIYEQNADVGTEDFFGCNDGLGRCGDEVKKIARKFRGAVVDIHAFMNEVNDKAQKEDPSFTLVGKDRVHPGDVGHFVVAYTLLKAQGMTPYVSKMKLSADSGKVLDETNCKISAVKASKSEVAFECLENALPYPVPEGAAGALKLVPFEKDLNQETLIVEALEPGAYEVLIDDEPVGECSADELKAGVNLASNEKTPQYKQALEVSALNAKRQGLESSRLRAIAAVRHGMLSKAKVNPDDFEAAKKVMLEQLEKMQGSPYYAYNKGMVEAYIKYKPTENDTVKEIGEAVSKMYEVNQPKCHKFLIRKK